MRSPIFLNDRNAPVVGDTSTIINLNATSRARTILQIFPNPVVIVDIVVDELKEGHRRGKKDAEKIAEIITEGLIQVVQLDKVGLEYFEQLVIGAGGATLDDGEAATISYALAQGGVALIDEKKAIRICTERYPNLRLGCTLDLLGHPEVEASLGREVLASVVFEALQQARMSVLPQDISWVIDLIGFDRASTCLIPSCNQTMTGAKVAPGGHDRHAASPAVFCQHKAQARCAVRSSLQSHGT